MLPMCMLHTGDFLINVYSIMKTLIIREIEKMVFEHQTFLKEKYNEYHKL